MNNPREFNIGGGDNEKKADSKKIKTIIKQRYSYPNAEDPELLYKIMKKREFYYHAVPKRPKLDDYKNIKDYRTGICEKHDSLYEHQALIANIINPGTPYKGMLIFHGLGSGKTCAGVAIAERFKDQVLKYNTKIHILVPGPFLRESWQRHLLICTGDTYLKNDDSGVYMDEHEKNRQKKLARSKASEYYKFMSYRSFYRKVLGERIVDRKVIKDSKVRVSYRKTEEGDFERDVGPDKLHNLNNSVIIVDEAHNITGNIYGEALKTIIKNSVNLKIVLLTATPMKNVADHIVELINYLRPKDSPMKRDKIFNSHKNHLMDFKPGGAEYFRKMAKGYVSHVRGADPLTYARRVDKGTRPKGLRFTKVIRCPMMSFQRQIYDIAIASADDALDRKSEAVSNFVFPGLTSDRKGIMGYHGIEGLNLVKNQIKILGSQLSHKLGDKFFGEKEADDIIYITQDNKSITGRILKMPYLKYFSTKFYRTMKKLSRLVWGKKGTKSAFIYSNLVRIGIHMFQEIMIQNGYLEYQSDSSNYQITGSTICYFCGKTYEEHRGRTSRNKSRYSDMNGGFIDEYDIDDETEESDDDVIVKGLYDNKGSESIQVEKVNITIENISKLKQSETSTDFDDNDNDNVNSKKNKNKNKNSKKKNINFSDIPHHKFYPATFITVTGAASEESSDGASDDKKKLLDDVFNRQDNKNGKYIKFILGSKVMNEGLNLKNIGEVHILDVYYNLGRTDQVIGRGIRNCSHYKLMSEENPFPKVNVYKYVVCIDKGLSNEEDLYRKAEEKYMLVKKVERLMKEVAIDCPLNLNGNMFAEEVDAHKDCVPFGIGEKMCPMVCDYTDCEYKCNDKKLNAAFYDPSRKLYRRLGKFELDYSTFTHGLARNEIDYSKEKIKDMYITGYMFKLEDIVKHVKNSYPEHKKDMFDDFFVFKALDELTPVTNNDFNNFKDIVTDKHHNTGYLIYRNVHYIFQPDNLNEDVPMDYRMNFNKDLSNNLSLYNYLKNTHEYKKYQNTEVKSDDAIFKEETSIYDFDSIMDYYDNRKEFKYVGIIDKEVSRRKSKKLKDMKDVFKIREKRSKILEKKRGTGIPSLKGAVCSTSKDKKYLLKIAKIINAVPSKSDTRVQICDIIKNKMLELEKYGTDKKSDKLTYIMIPSNHNEYPFPYNLEDRIRYITEKLKVEIKYKINIKTTTTKISKGENKGKPSYKMVVSSKQPLKEYNTLFTKHHGTLNNNTVTFMIE